MILGWEKIFFKRRENINYEKKIDNFSYVEIKCNLIKFNLIKFSYYIILLKNEKVNYRWEKMFVIYVIVKQKLIRKS